MLIYLSWSFDYGGIRQIALMEDFSIGFEIVYINLITLMDLEGL